MWKPLPAPWSRYDVSQNGQIRNRITGLIRKPGIHTCGYRTATLIRDDGKKVTRLMHRMILLGFRGPCPPKHETNHIDGHKDNNSLKNLEYVTRSENHLHRYRVLGQKPVNTRGERNPRARFSNEDVRTIRSLLANGMTQVEIARRYGTVQPAISAIHLRKTWTHI